MPSPFPGMDPYLERPELWPGLHNRLIAGLDETLGPLVRPRYYVALEERIYSEDPPELLLVGRPDLAVVRSHAGPPDRASGSWGAATGVLEVEVPLADRVRETYLELRAAQDGEVVTVIEILSPSNKRPGEGRREYLRKRAAVLQSLTSLVEIDLLRIGDRMPLVQRWPTADYGVLVSRSWLRPRAHLTGFTLRDPLPAFPVPLREGEDEPSLDLGAVFMTVYDRASYDLRIDYGRPPEPPLRDADASWAAALAGQRSSNPAG